MTTKQATVLASEVRTMKSKYTGRKYRISIALPYAYFNSRDKSWPAEKPLKKWPVVYLTDANWYFGMITDMVRVMAWCGSTTDAIIVGIGYAQDKNAAEVIRDSGAFRTGDFTPVRDKKIEQNDSKSLKRKVETGGAGKFLEFIKHELIPAVESEFKADPQRRILAGHSYGGLFAAFALLAEPGLFESYIVGSPSLWFGDKCVFKQEELFAKRHKKLPAKVHLWVGESEESADFPMVSNTIRFGAILESRKYKGLSLVRKIFADDNHCEVVAPGFQAGLKMALKQ
jgi:predicted alpha/beta superfamily hydrolase